MLDGTPAPATPLPVLRLEGVGLIAGTTTVLAGIDLDIAGGGVTVVMGPNGAGKTTLLRLMMGLAAPTGGRITLGRRADGLQPRRAFVFQRPVMLRRSAAGNVAFARRAADLPADRKSVARLLGTVGLGDLAPRFARRLSGGEQQRLALARALAREPDLLFLDEPTANLDPAQTRVVEEIITRIRGSGVKVVISTHNPGQARRLGGDIVLVVRGRIAETGPAEAFFTEPRTGEARRFLAGDLVD